MLGADNDDGVVIEAIHPLFPCTLPCVLLLTDAFSVMLLLVVSSKLFSLFGVSVVLSLIPPY